MLIVIYTNLKGLLKNQWKTAVNPCYC